MATSGTTSFNLDIDEVIKEAIDRAGGEPQLGYDPVSARRSLNLLLTEWVNRGINLWTLDQQTQPLTQGTANYTLDTDTVDLMSAVLRRNSIDYTLDRMGFAEYLNLPNKTTQGRPTKLYIDRQRDAPVMYLYFTPENSTDEVVYYRVRRIQDVTKSAGQQADLPYRFLPALCSGLAYYMGRKRPGIIDKDRMNWINSLQAAYESDLAFAQQEDRERVSTFIVPPGWTKS